MTYPRWLGMLITVTVTGILWAMIGFALSGV